MVTVKHAAQKPGRRAYVILTSLLHVAIAVSKQPELSNNTKRAAYSLFVELYQDNEQT